MSFLSSSNRIDLLRDQKDQPFELLSFGNEYLDHCLGGIHASDLVVLTAKTGVGKTELATQVAISNSMKGRRVHFFALEADRNEIESRIRFKKIAEAFYIQKVRDPDFVPNYQDWLYRKQPWLEVFEPEIDLEMKSQFKTLNTFYRDVSFNIKTFESSMHQIGDHTDLIILDHLHYFDFEDDNENRAMKETVKQIRALQVHYRKPIVLIVHLRKMDKRFSGLIPDLEDIHGSSDITKIATKIIAAAPARDIKSEQRNVIPTYFRVLKNRHDSSRCYNIGVVGFDITRNQYAEKYQVGEVNFENTEVKILDSWNLPRWAKRY